VLYELYIGWNNLNSTGGKALFSALSENDSLKVLDVCKIKKIFFVFSGVSFFILFSLRIYQMLVDNNLFPKKLITV